MTFEEYQKNVMKTWNHSPAAIDQIYNALFGLMGELGEIVEMYKKHIFHGIIMDPHHLMKEIGDVQYYLTVLADLEGFNLGMIAAINSEKLAKRYPDGFIEGGGNRGKD